MTQAASSSFRDLPAVFSAELTPVMLWVRDEHARIIVQNEQCFCLRGDASGSDDFLHLVHPEDRPKAVDLLNKLLAGHQSVEVEYRLRDAEGNYRWVIERSVPAIFGNESTVSSIAFDITERKRASVRLAESEKQFRNLIEGSIQGIYVHRDWKIQFANQALADIFGYAGPEEILALESAEGFYAPQERDRICAYLAARKDGRPAPELYEAACLRRDGTPIWAEFRVKKIEWLGSTAMQCVVIDITNRKRAEDALKDQNALFTAALDNMSQGLCMFDAEQRLVVSNRRYGEMYHLPPEFMQPGVTLSEIVQRRIDNGIYAGNNPKSYAEERQAWVSSHEPGFKTQTLSDGRTMTIARQPLEGGGWLTTHTDITELHRIEAQLAHLAHHDALTDLPNRVLLRQRIEELMPLSRRGRRFALLCLDLDHFKGVNDTLGHPAGDRLLIAVAERLRAGVRETDTVARLGGDEFAILQTSEDQPKDAAGLGARVCELLAAPFDLDGQQVVIGTSVGISIAPHDGADPDQLFTCADMALYRSKHEGRGIYRFFEAAMDAEIQSRRRLEMDLRTAFERDEFSLMYQPVLDLVTGQISACEALLRWHHAERGYVSPDEFIPAAEEIGLIGPLGEWVIRRACMDAAGWPPEVGIAVNLSPAQFRSDNLARTVFSALATSGLAATRLELEITESVMLQENAATLEMLHELKKMGVSIVLDDFGTGYASLSYLRSFPFDKIKIDGSFVRDTSESEHASAIVRAVASLSTSLGMRATAEGVETAQQRDMVRSAGYREMQGYLFSPPLPKEKLLELFTRTCGQMARAV